MSIFTKILDFFLPMPVVPLPPVARLVARIEFTSFRGKPVPDEWRPIAIFADATDGWRNWTLFVHGAELGENGRYTATAVFLVPEADWLWECGKIFEISEGRKAADAIVLSVIGPVWLCGRQAPDQESRHYIHLRQKEIIDHGDTRTMECRDCGKTWDEELPQ